LAPPQPISRSLRDLAEADLGLPEFYVEPLITPDSTTLLFGAREAGKTQFVLTLFKALQQQSALFGRYPCQRIRAALVEVDMPLVQVQKRVKLALEFFPYEDDLFRIVELRSLDLPTVKAADPWVKELQAFQPEMVIFDSLRKCHRLDEGSPTSPSIIYGRARDLFPDAARVFLHHIAKVPLLIQSGATLRAEEESYRGTTAWLDDADTGLLLSRKGNRRSFQVVRGRHTAEDIKTEIVALHFNKQSLLLEATESGPVQALKQWLGEHPAADLAEVNNWLHATYPGKSERTYRRWREECG
jgi:hypothetical protein